MGKQGDQKPTSTSSTPSNPLSNVTTSTPATQNRTFGLDTSVGSKTSGGNSNK